MTASQHDQRKQNRLMIAARMMAAIISRPLSDEDKEFIYHVMPTWVKHKAPEGLDPTMYGTLSAEGDDVIRERAEGICNKYNPKETADMAVRYADELLKRLEP